MRRFPASLRLPQTVSVIALAAAFATPAYAQSSAAPGPVTQTEVKECSKLPTEQERQLCIQGQASAEGTPDEAGELATLPATEAAEQRAESGQIVITGSRIRKSEFTSPDPVQIINPQLGIRQGQAETVELINSTPIAAGSVQITSAISTNFVTNGGEGAQTVALRGLGAERTLVLLNGRRAGPAGVRGGVASFDLNTLPTSIVSSIEILKTGASSIYGSDAIAGVVNILTKKETDGIELRAFGSIPQHSGGETYNVNATYGKDFGRGHFLISADYFKRNNLRRKDRSFLDCEEEFLKFADGRRADIRDVRNNLEPACSGVLHNSIITANDFSGRLIAPSTRQPLFVTQFQVGDELTRAGCVRLDPLTAISAPANAFGCNFDELSTGVLNQYSELERNTDVISDLRRYTLYGEGAYNITDGIELYTELLYNKRKTHTNGISQVSSLQFTGSSVLPSATVDPVTGGLSLNPAFEPAFCDDTVFNCTFGAAGDPFNADWAGNFLLLPLILVDADSGTNIDYWRGVVGARGDFGGFAKNFSWDIYGQYSRSNGDYFQDITRADSIFTQDLRTQSCVGLTAPISGLPCIDIDFSDPNTLAGNFTEAERAFLFDRDHGNTLFKQLSGEATVTGDLFNLPAGPLGVALGVTIRRDEINDTPGFNSRNNNTFNLTSAGITAGSTVSKEIFGEVEIPLLRDQPLVQRLNLSAAGRVTRVKAERRDGEGDKFGDETWKLGGDWQVNDWLRFRGSIGTSFRAPALFELFLENQTGFQRQQTIDICSDAALKLAQGTITQNIFNNCVAAGMPVDYRAATGGVLIIGGGGLGNLNPETAKAKTASIILTPTFAALPDTRVSLAVDYFDITVNDEISTIGGANIVRGCYNSRDFANEPLCDLITRSTSPTDFFNITQIEDTFINVNSQRNRGVDLTGRIVHDLGGMGKLSLLAQMTWQLEDIIQLFDRSTEVQNNGNAGDPRWVGDFNVSWSKGPWTVLYGLDVIGATSNLNEMIRTNGGPCRTSLFRPGVPQNLANPPNGSPPGTNARTQICPDARLGPVDYHALSVTREFGKRYEVTIGVANLFDTKPPRASTALGPGISAIGQAPVFGSQYDWLGRRVFFNLRGNF